MKPDSKTGVTTYYTLLQEHLKDFKLTTVTPSDAPWLTRKLATAYYLLFTRLFPNNAFVVTRYYLFLLRFALKRKIGSEKVRIFHAQDPISAFAVRRIFKKSQIVTTCHIDNPVTELQIKYKLSSSQIDQLNKQFKTFFNTSNQFICVSQYVIEKSKCLFPAHVPVSLVYNAVDFQKIGRHTREKKDGKIVITNCGTLDNRKNQRLLIELAKELVQLNFSNFEIWLIGAGANYDTYKELIQEYKLNDFVKLLGWVDNPWEIISQSHIYIHTATNEAFGYAIIEAIAAGTFAVGIDSGGIGEVLGKEGVVSLDEAKEKFKELILSCDLKGIEMKTISQYNRALQKFDTENWQKQHSDIYKSRLEYVTN
jgi:glycosyltransferase involved in cell wall biosynthesis